MSMKCPRCGADRLDDKRHWYGSGRAVVAPPMGVDDE